MELKVKENGDDDACSTAMMAAMETMGKYCGEGKLTTDIVIGGTKHVITLPEEIIQIRADRTLTEEQRTSKIKESRWAERAAEELCSTFFESTIECRERVKRKLAEGMVSRAKAITQKLTRT